jgi:tetratricopeptide (TPR) repeat protein
MLPAVLPATLDAEHDNLRVALRWALEHRRVAALQLATALWRYWLTRGFLAEGRGWLEAALAANPEPSPLRARALIALAVFDVRRGTDRRLAELGAEAVRIHRAKPGAWEGLAQALHSDAVLAYMRGTWDEAWERSNESAEVAEDAGIPRLRVAARHLQAIVLMGRGRLAESREAFDEVAADLDTLSRRTLPFLPPILLGFTVEHAGTPSPRLYFEETALLARLAGVGQARAYVQCNLAELARLGGDLDEPLRLLEQARERFVACRDRDGEALALSRRGCLHRIRGEYAEGRAALEQSLMLRSVIGDRRAMGLTSSNLGLLAAAEGDVDAGRAAIEEAVGKAREMQDGAAEAGLTITLASVCADAGDLACAERHLLTALEASTHIPGNARASAWGHAVLADVLHRLDRGADAGTAAAESSRLFRALGAVDPFSGVRPRVEALQRPG